MLIDIINIQDGKRSVAAQVLDAVSDHSTNNSTNNNTSVTNNAVTNNVVIPQIMVTPPDNTNEGVLPSNSTTNAGDASNSTSNAITNDVNNTINNTVNNAVNGTAGNTVSNKASNAVINNTAGGNANGGSAPPQIAGTPWEPTAAPSATDPSVTHPNTNVQVPPQAHGMHHGGQRGAGHGHNRGRSNSSSRRGGQRRSSHQGGLRGSGHHGGQRRPSHNGGRNHGGSGRIMGPPQTNDPYKWSVAMSRNQRRKTTFGNAATTGGLSGAPIPIRQIWVSRVSRGDEKDIENHMQINNIEINGIEKTSHPEAMYSSYRITIPAIGSDRVFNESFWPVGVRCQKWFDKPSRNYDSDTDSTYDQYDDTNTVYNNYNGSVGPFNNIFS